jgi:hypothetical protein
MDIVPADMWICCQCGGGNLISHTDVCPDCLNPKCGDCPGPGDEYTLATSLFSDADNYALDRGPMRPSWTSQFANAAHFNADAFVPRRYTSPFLGQPKVTTRGDVWTCCSCGTANLMANAPERCPVCEHYRCDCCTE